MMNHSQPHRKPSWWKKPLALWFFAIAACWLAFMLGWFAANATNQIGTPHPLRLSGYQFTSPLLSCNFSALRVFPQSQSMNTAILATINAHIAGHDVAKASTYFLDFANTQWSATNQNETYYPSSLGKIPIMMAYYRLAESSPQLLDKKITYPQGGPDLNNSQDIKPAEAIVPGKTYSIDDLIDYMIRYSDNNATQLLYNSIDKTILQNVYNDLQIPTEDDPTITNFDFITPQQIATLFRILYNATYLSHDASEKALQLMSQSSFIEGIPAGVPSSTVVSHKFGLVGITSGIKTTEHELHDCGIVYGSPDTYVLCVMTRGSASLDKMQNTIADISRTVYDQVKNGKQ